MKKNTWNFLSVSQWEADEYDMHFTDSDTASNTLNLVFPKILHW